MEKYFRLKNGKRIVVRPIEPSDRRHFSEGIVRLSSRSIYHRFHSLSYKLDDSDLEYFTNVDQKDHVAIGALDLSMDEKPGIGVGRFVRIKDSPKSAELAITVLDEYQEHGLGTILLNELKQIAPEVDVELFKIYIHAHRRSIIEWLKKSGAVPVCRTGEIMELDLSVKTNKN